MFDVWLECILNKRHIYVVRVYGLTLHKLHISLKWNTCIWQSVFTKLFSLIAVDDAISGPLVWGGT